MGAIKVGVTVASDRQAQRAGPNSQQHQAARDINIYNGVSEDRVREIVRSEAQQLVEQYSLDARPVAEERLAKFDELLIDRLSAAQRLNAFADPSFHLALRRAQMGATATERDDDYDMLARLLTDRAERGAARFVRAGVDRAIEIVENVDAESLHGLTMAQAAMQYAPSAPNVREGLKALDSLFSELISEELLPAGVEWIEHLEGLGALRVSSAQTFLPYREYLRSRCKGYLSPGVEQSDPRVLEALRRYASLGNGQFVPVTPHELRPDHVRISAASDDAFIKLLRAAGFPEASFDECQTIARETFSFGSVDPDAVNEFDQMAAEFTSIESVNTWWTNWPIFFNTTTVGRVLARANAQRLDDAGLLPPID